MINSPRSAIILSTNETPEDVRIWLIDYDTSSEVVKEVFREMVNIMKVAIDSGKVKLL